MTLKDLDILLRNIHLFANVYQNFHAQYLQTLQTNGPIQLKISDLYY
jgi:hypothetical protein